MRRAAVFLPLALLAAGVAQAQERWEPPLGRPAKPQPALAFAPKGSVPVFRDGTAAVDAWYGGGALGLDYHEADNALMRCVVANNAAITVARIFWSGDKPMFAVVRVDKAPSCIGVMFYRDLRLTQP